MDVDALRGMMMERRGDFVAVLSAAGTVLWVDGPSAVVPESFVIGGDFLDLVHAADRASVLELLTHTATQPRTDVRIRGLEAGWSNYETTALDHEGDIALVLRDVTETRRIAALLEANEAVLAAIVDGVAAGVAFDAIARAAQCAVPGSLCAVYESRDNGYELVAAPSLPPAWARRAYRLDGVSFDATFETDVSTTRGPLFDLATEFQLGQAWVVAPPAPNGRGGAEAVACVFVNEKRFLSRNERDCLCELGDLLAKLVVAAARNEAAREQTRLDDLTAVLTRRVLLKELMLFSDAVSVVLVHVDGLRAINESYGYDAGDAVVRSVGTGLRGITRGHDAVGRLDGATFVIVAGVRSSRRLGGFVDRILEGVRAPVVAAGNVIEPRCSVIEVQSQPGEHGLAVLNRAEAQLRAAVGAQNAASGHAVNDR